tara:strand:+ start:87 stop:359 length:273 start_codon:yes stop_codon:yes gene_type:complete
MKLVEVHEEDNNISIKIHPILKAVFLFYIGGVLVDMCLNDSLVSLSSIMLIIISAIGAGFMTYGIIIFIGDVKKSKTIKDLANRIKNNLK